MKFIVLDCKRGGKERGAILSVGPKADITLEEAKVLISERMASEYTQPVVSEVDTAEVTRLTEELKEQGYVLAEETGQRMLLLTKVDDLTKELIASQAEVTRLTGELETAKSEAQAEVTRLNEALTVSQAEVTRLTEENAKLVLTAAPKSK